MNCSKEPNRGMTQYSAVQSNVLAQVSGWSIELVLCGNDYDDGSSALLK